MEKHIVDNLKKIKCELEKITYPNYEQANDVLVKLQTALERIFGKDNKWLNTLNDVRLDTGNVIYNTEHYIPNGQWSYGIKTSLKIIDGSIEEIEMFGIKTEKRLIKDLDDLFLYNKFSLKIWSITITFILTLSALISKLTFIIIKFLG